MKKILLLTKTLLAAVLLCVGQNAWAETLVPTVKMTYVDYNNADVSYGEVTTAYTGYNKLSGGSVGFGNTGWGVNRIAYVQVDASALPDGATITAASLSAKVSGPDRNHTFCIGYNSSTWSSTVTYNTADRTINELSGTTISTTASKGQTGSKTGSFNILSAFTTLSSNVITFIIYDTAAGGGTIEDVSASITYTTATAYKITFSETNNVSATVKISGVDVTTGAILANGNYDFTATATGYKDYAGSFTVTDEDKEVSFTMTPKTVCNYSVNAIDAEDGIIKAGIVSGTCYADESTSFYLPSCVLVDGTLYFMKAESSYKSETVTNNNQVFSYPYTTNYKDNVVFFVEGEDISGASTSTPGGNQQLASKGHMGRGSNLNVTTLPAGTYTVCVKYINTNSGAHSLLVKAGDTDVINDTDVKGRPTKDGHVTLTESTAITLTAAASSTSGVDYIYIIKTGESVTVSDAGMATYVPSYDLDFSATGIKAYKAKVTAKDVCTLTEVTNVPAGTPVVLVKDGGATENIPVATGAAAVSENDLVAGTGAAVATTDGDNTNMILNNIGGNVGFYFAAGQTVATNRAYLHFDSSLAPDEEGESTARSMRIVFDGVTGVDNVEAAAEAKAQDGKFIENGKIVIVKNGVKYNAAGQQVK